MTNDLMRQRGQAAHRVTVRRGQVRRALRAGEVSIADVFAAPDWSVQDMFVSELLLMCPGIGRYRLEAIGDRAHGERINLVVRLCRAPKRTREWAAAEASRYEASVVSRGAHARWGHA